MSMSSLIGKYIVEVSFALVFIFGFTCGFLVRDYIKMKFDWW